MKRKKETKITFHGQNGKVTVLTVRVASSFLDRLIGLMFSRNVGPFDGLLIKSCNSIHTCFMNYPIDVAFLDGSGKVVRIIRHMRPWRMSLPYFRATQVLEMMGGGLPEFLKENDILRIEEEYV